MRQDPTDDELLRSYLLGELPEPEADRLEQRLLVEDELFDLLEALEAELLAAGSRGELAPAERERVFRRLASSPEGRERLALARSLNALADRPAAPVVPFRRRAAHPRRLQWAALAAAGLLAATGLFWFTQQTRQGGDSAPRVVQERPAPANPAPVPPPVPEEKPPAPQAAPPDRLARTDEGTPTRERQEPVKAVLALALTTMRDAGEGTEQLHLPQDAEVAELQIDLDGLESAGPFHAVLRSKDQGTVWEKSGLKPRTLDWGTALVLDVPAQSLAPGRYEVAVTSSADPEEMTQEFSVVREGR